MQELMAYSRSALDPHERDLTVQTMLAPFSYVACDHPLTESDGFNRNDRH